MLKKIPIVGRFLLWIESEDMDYGLWVLIGGTLIAIMSLHWMGISQFTVLSWVFALAPIWLPLAAFFVFFWKWMDMVGKSFYLYSGRTTIEVVMPPEVYKSPAAMETVLNQIFNKATQDNLMETYLQGKRPQNVSLEIVSRGGVITFYVNAATKKGIGYFEKALYAQYPGIEIRRLAVDYTAEIPHDLDKNGEDVLMISGHMQKTKGYAPIKTYLEFGLDDLPKEEEKVDPLTQVLEYLGSIDAHEQVWVQIILTAHRDSSFKYGSLKKTSTWEKAVQAEIDEIMMRDPETKGGPVDVDGMPRITPGERETVEAMERNVDKVAYNVNMRWIYFTKEGGWDGDMIAGMLRTFAAYDAGGRNKIGLRWRTDFNYKFISDPFGTRLEAYRKQELKEYKLRKLFPKNQAYQGSVMSVEEIATMWHPIGTAALTPTINRVSSVKSTAPTNLPTGEMS